MIVPKSRSKYTNKKKLVTGTGFINNAIGKLGDLGIELHLAAQNGEYVPNGSFNNLQKYSFAGPGTQLEKRLEEGYEGINKLDRKAKLHDLFYHLNSDTATRNISDRALEHVTEEIANDPTIDEPQRKDAWLVKTLMKHKAKFGMGVSSSSKKQKSKN